MKKKLRIIIDIVMTVSMPVLMAYELAGAVLHEYMGIVIFFLFIAHHVLNFGWIRGVAKGRYNIVRTVSLVVNLLLLAVMVLLPISGIMMSKHLFSFLDFGAAIGFARVAHLLVSYWGFLLMSFHIGLHLNAMSAVVKSRRIITTRLCRILPHLVAVAVMGYGIYAFMKRGLNDYLFLKIQFVFYDFSEPLIFFLLDYLAIMAMTAGIGYYFMRLLRKITHNKTKRRQT